MLPSLTIPKRTVPRTRVKAYLLHMTSETVFLRRLYMTLSGSLTKQILLCVIHDSRRSVVLIWSRLPCGLKKLKLIRFLKDSGDRNDGSYFVSITCAACLLFLSFFHVFAKVIHPQGICRPHAPKKKPAQRRAGVPERGSSLTKEIKEKEKRRASNLTHLLPFCPLLRLPDDPPV